MMELNFDLPLPQVPSVSADTDPLQGADIEAGYIESAPLQVSRTNPSMVIAPPRLSELMPASGDDLELASAPLPMLPPPGNEFTADARHPSRTMTTNGQSSHFDPAVIAAMATDPMHRLKLVQLHAQTSDLLLTTIDEIYTMLAPDALPRASAQSPASPTSIRNLMKDQRRGEIMSKGRREVVEGIVMGSLLNVDNPEWNPTDPATCNESSTSALAAILQLGP